MTLAEHLLDGGTLTEMLLDSPDMFLENIAKRLPHLKREFPDMEDKEILQAAEFDPFKGKFTRWILLMVKDGNVILPEDGEDVYDAIRQFSQLNKKRDFEGERDINKYTSFAELSRTLRANSDVETKGEIQRRLAVEGAELLAEKGEYALYKVTTLEAGHALGWKDTRWCVRAPDQFKNYGPPFYYLSKNGKPFKLLHISKTNSLQVADVDDGRTPITEFYEVAGDLPIMVWVSVLEATKGSKLDQNTMQLAGKSREEVEATLLKDPDLAVNYAARVKNGRWPEAEPSIANQAHASYKYALDVIGGPWEPGEPAILKDPAIAYQYARDVRGPWEPVAKAVQHDAKASYNYAKEVVKGRFEMGEPAMAKLPEVAYNYAYHVLQGRFPEGEQTLLHNPDSAKQTYEYAANVIRGPWPEAEPVLAQDPETACNYAEYCLSGRFLAGEDVIAQHADYAYIYALNVLRKPFPEGEAVISQSAAHAYMYAADILKGPFPEGEAAINQSARYAEKYKALVAKSANR